MKIIVNKMVGEGEQFAIEININDDVLKKEGVEGAQARLSPALALVDARLLELNTRLLNANRLAQKLTPEANAAMRQCVDILWGRQTPPMDLPAIQKEEKAASDAILGEKAARLAGALEAAYPNEKGPDA